MCAPKTKKIKSFLTLLVTHQFIIVLLLSSQFLVIKDIGSKKTAQRLGHMSCIFKTPSLIPSTSCPPLTTTGCRPSAQALGHEGTMALSTTGPEKVRALNHLSPLIECSRKLSRSMSTAGESPALPPGFITFTGEQLVFIIT